MSDDQLNYNPNGIVIYSNQYFRLKAIVYTDPRYDLLLLSNRPDTQENYGSTGGSKCKNKKDLILIAESLIGAV